MHPWVLIAGACSLACAAMALPAQTPSPAAERALRYVRAHASALGVTPDDLSDITVTGETASPHTGVTHVYVRQRFNGIEIAGADVTVHIAPNGTMTHQAGSLISNVASAANRPRPALSRSDAIARAAKEAGVALSRTDLKKRSAKQVYHPVAPDRLRLGWQVDIEIPDGSHHWAITVDAESGAILDKFDRVVSDDPRCS
jgi:extracellular elastinolytic metalloproteinase